MMRNISILIILGLVLSSFTGTNKSHRFVKGSTENNPDSILKALKWRNIGPYRGGRVTAVAGHQSDKFTYYMGVTGGGVWKTTDAGNKWRNISDGYFKTSSVGAVTVSESDPNVIYVGMGEAPIRGVKSSHGDGVYKSVDGGRTWRHLGLELTRHIAKISVHPKNPDIVYVAAQGNPFAKTKERGIYKSINGGKTWENILFVNETAGANDICMDVNNPDILYVSIWDHFRHPWQLRSGGPGSAIYKTNDGGESWNKLSEGLPKEMGKIGVAVSPANSDRVWAIVEADKGGLYRSDNGGRSWKLLNKERLIRTRSWYYMHIFADPQDEETVYILNAPMMKSSDGGKKFTRVRTPHGDNHDLWINPLNNKIMIEGNDGGGNISFDGGKNWSAQWNQPTAQFYRVNTDNLLFYRVYGGQQDNSTVAILSRTRHNGIGRQDWFSCGGAENSSISFDRNKPDKIYATGGRLTEYDVKNESTRNIITYPNFDLALNGTSLKYRFNWNAPVLVSKHDTKVIYHAAQMVLKSSDLGKSWEEISPDLTRNQKEKQGFGAVPYTNEGAGGELYNTISYLAECPHNKGTIWVGTDDGLVHLSTDDGKTWSNVTPKGIGAGIINTIEVSPHNARVVYLTVLKHKLNDLKPYIYKTKDAGRSWKLITNGISASDYVRVVREDPVQKGLLFAGTFSGVYISYDEGTNWKFLNLNLPIVPITDLKIQHNDLVAATEGRAFWILDDFSPLRQYAATDFGKKNYLFKPSDVYLISQKHVRDEIIAPNPPNGAIIYFNIAENENIDSLKVELTIVDKNDSVVRKLIPAKSIKLNKGLNRIIWDLREEGRKPKTGFYFYPGYRGIRVAPSKYNLKLLINKQNFSHELVVNPDPEYPITDEYLEQRKYMEKAFSSLDEIHTLLNKIQGIRLQLNRFKNVHKQTAENKQVFEYADDLLKKIDSLENRVTQPRQTTVQDVINYQSRMDTQYGYLLEQLDEAGTQIVYGAKRRLDDLEKEWLANKTLIIDVLNKDLVLMNRMIMEYNFPHINTIKNLK